MSTLYNNNTTICKLKNLFFDIFSEETFPTRQHLFDLMLSIIGLNCFQSVKFNFEHFISEISDFSLNSYYFTLNESKIDLCDWMNNIITLCLSIIPEEYENQPIILSIDDTLIEKFGEKFEYYSKLYDHASHNGSNYLNGHCFVSIMMSVPVKDGDKKHYISLPIGYRIWKKEESKLKMAADLVEKAMKIIDPKKQVILLCDSWYPKKEINELITKKKISNLTIIANVRSDTAIFSLPPVKTGKRGRPRKRGEQLFLNKDFKMHEIAGEDFLVGIRPVKTNLYSDQIVYAIVTKAKKGNSYRLFICTGDPEKIVFDTEFLSDKAASYTKEDIRFLPLAIYFMRWSIEVSYYEQKTFWGLENYRLRKGIGIERLINLISLTYTSMKLLPYVHKDFSSLKNMSTQQTRFVLGKQINKELFFAVFEEHVKISKIPNDIMDFLVMQFNELCNVA